MPRAIRTIILLLPFLVPVLAVASVYGRAFRIGTVAIEADPRGLFIAKCDPGTFFDSDRLPTGALTYPHVAIFPGMTCTILPWVWFVLLWGAAVVAWLLLTRRRTKKGAFPVEASRAP